MKQLLWLVASVTLIVAPCATQAAMTPMAASTYGAGPHGYDWALGAWSCRNALPSPMGGPSKQTLNVTRANGGAIMYHATGEGFDNTWYTAYVPSSKSWVSPFIVANGTYGSESTSQTGRKIVWLGTAYDASGKSVRVRDTYAIGNGKYGDLGEYMSGGTWKTQYTVTCMKG
ncbi:MAG: hypothetical protein ABI231_07175 [Candidatus Tumulicola sp.]